MWSEESGGGGAVRVTHPWPGNCQDAKSWRCREVIPPGGKVKFQTLTISSSKITLEPTKPSISQSCPGAHGLGPSPKSSLGVAPTRLSWKSHVAAKRLIPGEHCEAAVGTSLSHVPTGHSDEEKTEKRALQKSRGTYKIQKNRYKYDWIFWIFRIFRIFSRLQLGWTEFFEAATGVYETRGCHHLRRITVAWLVSLSGFGIKECWYMKRCYVNRCE